MTHERDGTKYEITTASVKGGFTATWICGRCGEAGAITSTCETADEAALRARARLFSDHHSRARLRLMSKQ
jgi:hypothetical protein